MPPEPLPSTEETARDRILVVEDSLESQLVVAAQLDHLGYDHEIVDHAEAALAALRRTRFSLALVDWHLPGMDGLELIRHLRAEERLKGRPRTPVVSLTARSRPEDIDACLSAGADEHLAKPAGLAELEDVLLRWTNQGGGSQTRHGTTDDATTQRPTDRVVDTGTLNRLLEDIGDVDLFRSVVETYLAQLPQRLDTLASARQLGPDAVVSAAHSLKGTSATLGASRLTEMAARLESDARLGRCVPPAAPGELEKLARLTTQAMKQYIDAIGVES